jgi:HD-like signal output (HDOD) protein
VTLPVSTNAELVRGQAIEGLDRLPAFSPILNRLLAMVASDDVSFAEVAVLIENDAVLAGNVLRYVNSAQYGFQGTVNSVRHAVAILGVNTIRNVALSFSISRMWTHVRIPEPWSGAKFNVHSVATALLADLIAQRARAPYPEGAFVAGLLHDVGKLIIAVSFPREFGAIRNLCELTSRSELECEGELIGPTHAQLSGLALERWRLPRPIERAAACHHEPGEADAGRLHLAHIVRTADRLANELGYSVLEHPKSAEPSDSAWDALELGHCAQRILDEFQVEFELSRALF